MRILTAHGESTSGTKHSLEIDPQPVGGFKWTVLGPTGKRHASVVLTRADATQIRDYLNEMLDES